SARVLYFFFLLRVTISLRFFQLYSNQLPSQIATKGSYIFKTQRRHIFNQKGCLIKMTFVKIGTHNGTFHCDEVLACYLLRQLPEYKDAEIIRTRDPVELARCDIVVDVGGVYDHKQHRYDHHQRYFQ
ncbi:hypothetical protein PDJAM_G00172810, partial [Pangasius djambal]|nr:hypothetical protein [Pangasius djambal]